MSVARKKSRRGVTLRSIKDLSLGADHGLSGVHDVGGLLPCKALSACLPSGAFHRSFFCT